MRKEKLIELTERASDIKFEVEISSKRMFVSQLLKLPIELLSFDWICFNFKLCCICIYQLWISFRYAILLSTFSPYLFNNFQNLRVYFPRNRRKIVQNFINSMIVSKFHKSFLNWTVTVSHDWSCLRVVTPNFWL